MLQFIAKYFTSKIYPSCYGNRNRSNTEFNRRVVHISELGNIDNYCEEKDDTNEPYRATLNNTFTAKQKVKRGEERSSLRIRGLSF